MTRFFYDTEFYEDGERIYPISIGMVMDPEDGNPVQEYYAEFYDTLMNDAILAKIVRSQWHRNNLLPHLSWQLRGIWQIKSDLEKFVTLYADPTDRAEFWAYYGDYDHVLLSQIWGSMIKLPQRFPMFTMDIKQYAVNLGNPQLPKQEGTEHHALADARWNLQAFQFLQQYEISTLGSPVEEIFGKGAVMIGPGTVTKSKEPFGNDFKIKRGDHIVTYTAT